MQCIVVVVVVIVVVAYISIIIYLFIYLAVYLQAWKRSYSARPPQLLELEKIKNAVNPRDFEIDNIKNEAILGDFLHLPSTMVRRNLGRQRLKKTKYLICHFLVIFVVIFFVISVCLSFCVSFFVMSVLSVIFFVISILSVIFCHLSFGLSFCLSLFVIFCHFSNNCRYFPYFWENGTKMTKNDKKWKKMTNFRPNDKKWQTKWQFFRLQKMLFFLEALSFFWSFFGYIIFRYSSIFLRKSHEHGQKMAKHMTNFPPNDHKKTTGQNRKTTKKKDKTETTKKWQNKWQTKLKWQKKYEKTQKNDKINIWIISRVWLRVSSKTMESWVQSWRTPTRFEFFQSMSMSLKCCACYEKVMPGHTKCCTCHAKSS